MKSATFPAKVKARVYLNFGPDWRTDFTVTLQAKARRLFRKAGLEPLSLEGREIRVRGWLKKFNGPMIEATHPEQIEVLNQEARSGAEGSATGTKQEARTGAVGLGDTPSPGARTGTKQEARTGAARTGINNE